MCIRDSVNTRIIFLVLQHNKGDITKITTTSALQVPTDGVVSGAPCIAFAGNGKHEADASPHANPLMAVLAMIVWLAKNGGLQFALLENVWGTLQWCGAIPPIFIRIVLVKGASNKQQHTN
eukprot:9533388-Karenia_brevis.AAC.1